MYTRAAASQSAMHRKYCPGNLAFPTSFKLWAKLKKKSGNIFRAKFGNFAAKNAFGCAEFFIGKIIAMKFGKFIKLFGNLDIYQKVFENLIKNMEIWSKMWNYIEILSTPMAATMSTSMSATTMSPRHFVRAQRRCQNGNLKVLPTELRTDRQGEVLEIAHLKRRNMSLLK